MYKEPLISVIISCFNGEKFIGEAIESVLNQVYQNWELIIVDDGSTDSSKKIIKKYISDDRIKLIEHKFNKGIPKTKNTGISAAKGKYISFLDQDDIWLQLKLELQVKCFEVENNNIGVVCTGMIFSDSKIKPLYIFRGFNDKDQKKLIKTLYLKPTNSSSIMMISQQCFSQIGIFNEDLIGWDDYELLMRIATKFQIKYIKKPLVIKRMHKNNMQKTYMVRNESEKVFDCILALHPFLKKYINIRESNKLYGKSIELLERNDKNLAYNNLRKSIIKNPKNNRAWLLYILVLLVGKYSLNIKKIISILRNSIFMFLSRMKK